MVRKGREGVWSSRSSAQSDVIGGFIELFFRSCGNCCYIKGTAGGRAMVREGLRGVVLGRMMHRCVCWDVGYGVEVIFF